MKTQRGFTLGELVIVLVITGILAAVAIPRLFDKSGFAARGARDFVASALRYAQKSAVAMRRNVCVTVGTTSVTMTYATTAGSGVACSGAATITNPATNLPYASTVYEQGATASGTTSLVFDALGRPMSSALSPLTSAASISISGYATALTIEPETGYVH